MSNSGQKHWEFVKHILKYLKGTNDAQLTFGLANATVVEGYTNSDYARNKDTHKSTSGYVFTYGGRAISWRSKLQEWRTLSTIEVEYIVMSEATKQEIWLQRLSAVFSAKSGFDHTPPTRYCNS